MPNILKSPTANKNYCKCKPSAQISQRNDAFSVISIVLRLPLRNLNFLMIVFDIRLFQHE
jgi:hypothetical protein